MAGSSQIVLKALGLYSDPSELTLQPGAMKEASNVVIRRNNIVEPRRGFNHYGNSFGSTTTRAKQVFEYRTRLMRHYDSILQWDTEVENLAGESVFQSFSQSVEEVQAGLRIKSVVANGNFYFTTNDGIKKISAANADGFETAQITKAGGIKALNIDTRLSVNIGSTTGFLPTDSTVAYRVLWNKKDANKNLIPGVPSERSVIYNSLQTMVVRDMLSVLAALDSLDATGSYYDDGDYVSTLKLPVGATAGEIRSNLIALASKLDKQVGSLFDTAAIASATIAGGICTVTFANGTRTARQVQGQDKIYLNGFTVAGGNGEQITGLQTVLDVTASGGSPPTITFSTTATGTVTLLNENIESGWFRAITQPVEPSVPATHDQLASLQTYLQNIIIELQSSRNLHRVAVFGGTPLEITTLSGDGVNVTVTTTGGDVRDYLTTGDLLDNQGVFTPDFTSMIGVHTVSSASSAATFTVSDSSTGSYSGSPSDTINRILRFSDSLKTSFITPLQVTTTANVFVDINVPTSATINDFYQIYRSDIKTAATTDVLFDLIPDDNLRLVYEAFPTQAQINARFITVEDVTPQSFFLGGAFLYTNPDTGEGILQADDLPPLAKDINTFKNYTFYANTSTLQRKTVNLLGVEQILTDFNNASAPSVSLVSDNATSEYKFVKGVQQTSQLTTGTSSNVTDGGYFNISTADDLVLYYVWFDKTGTAVDPAPAGRTGIKVDIVGLTTAADIAQRVSDTLSVYVDDFTTTVVGSVVTIVNVEEGEATDPAIITGLASPFAIATTVQGRGEKITQEVTAINAVAGNLYVTAGTADYFTLNTPFDRQRYYFWFNVTGGSMTNPSLNGRTGIAISVTGADTNNVVAGKINTAINLLTTLSSTVLSNVVTVTTTQYGPTVNATEVVSNAGFTISITQEGALDVLLSNLVSPALAVEQTAKSLVNVVNHDLIQEINAFYLSGSDDVPGIILFEAENLSLPAFYLLANTSLTGNSFSPNLSPQVTGITNTAANPTVITSPSHGLINGDRVIITASNSFPVIGGEYTITVVNGNSFSVPVNVITGGTKGVYSNVTALEPSDNEVKANRVYYSKLQQPEAVPILNYFDVSASDKAILRIFPLRDSLFIFKEDGLYRLSGEVAPFSVTLFDTSCVVVCPDSLAIANNFLFCYTTQGIMTVTENGTQDISKPIDITLLRLNTPRFVNFRTASWGVGYDSDNSYMFFTVVDPTDTDAKIAFYFSTLTNTWTTWDKSETCGIVNHTEDKLVLGSGDFNRLDKERKDFTRTDYADYELTKELEAGKYNSNVMIVQQANQISPGDTVYQEQTISIYDYDKLLKKLDIDPTVAPAYTITNATWASSFATFTLSSPVNSFLTVGNSIVVADVNPIGFNSTYVIQSLPSPTQVRVALETQPDTYISGGKLKFSYYNTLKLSPGADMREGLENLAERLDIDPGVVDTDYASAIGFYSGTGVTASAANPTVITSSSHGLLTGRYINVGASTTDPNIDNRYNVIRVNGNTFTIPVQVLTSGTLNYETLIDNFNDIKACYNIIIAKLNADTGVSSASYEPVETSTPVECLVDSVNIFNNNLVLNKSGLGFLVGPLTIFKSYSCSAEYAPITFDNYLFLKHFSEAQFFFLNKTFTEFNVKFASDLVPSFTNILFQGYGNGLFGNEAFGENYYGGNSHSAPFRTYVPQQKQKARFLRIAFEYRNARESFNLLGVSCTGRIISPKAYR